MSNRRAGTLKGNAVEVACGKRAGKLAELPDTFNGFPLLSASEREAIQDATGKHLVYGYIVDGVPCGIHSIGGMLRLYVCIARVRRALPTYGQKGRDGTVVPNSRAYRDNMVPHGFRQPGAPTDKDYWRACVRYCAQNGIDFYSPNGKDSYLSAHATDIPDGWVMLVGEQSAIQTVLASPPDWCAQSEPSLNTRVPIQGSGATKGMTKSQKRFKRHSIKEWIDEREAMAIIRAAGTITVHPADEMANAIIPAGTNKYYGIIRDAIVSVFDGTATEEQRQLFSRTFATDTDGNIVLNGIPHGATAEHAEELRKEAEREQRKAAERRKRNNGFADQLLADGAGIAIANMVTETDRAAEIAKAELRFAGSLTIQPIRHGDKI